MAGCLPMLLTMLVLFGFLGVVYYPVQYIFGVPADAIQTACESLGIASANTATMQTALIQAHQGMEQIISGKATTMRQIARALNMDRSFVARTLQLANLAPDIVKTIGENRQPVSLTLDKLRRGIPDSWEEQRKLFLGK